LSDATLTDYINDFLLYDMPEQLRLFTFRKTLTFYTQPNIDVYETNLVDTDDPLYDFKNAVITTHDPVYVAGYRVLFTQSRDEFFNIYPALQATQNIGVGDAATTNFTGTLSSTPLLRYNVLFESIDANNDGMSIYDEDGDGTLYGDFGAPSTIDYVTGEYDITFNAAPGAGEKVEAQIVSYQAARPQAVLYFDNKFTLRPVPDKPYQVRIETYIRPTELLDNPDEPVLEQHWQYIAIGAAKKIFEDRMDMESAQAIMPMFKEQELLVQRRTIVQQSNERSATIYTQQAGLNPNGWNWNNY
jgi:hypothetical protein